KATVLQAFAAGAQAYLFKNSSPDEFLSALKAMENGEFYLPNQLGDLSSEIQELAGSSNSHGKLDLHDPLSQLSKREREVFYLLADGMPNRVIAKKLYISPRTVETHRARVIKKLGFSSTADLIRYALRNNLLTL
ncbi:MAG: response regulator transcription factor, partial [Bdellovibrionales bacterium]|nr:response regulator transcription factor [Bdellovibrionales bacterium]